MLVFFAPPKLLRVSSIRSFSCSGIGTLGHDEHDFRVQRFRDFIVQRLSELMLTGWDQAFNQYDFCIFSVRVVVSDDLFHQHIFLIAGEQGFYRGSSSSFSGGRR
ncbi:Uncharacterised protein [Kluyvera cryocrescens]|uniref:Uncharacterized protein n=1 Tax=Kluyvera cryocrescens TaxID=580 RepID=A0A485AW73_KLUCR|nr:Uncharacterised protein [Kluyvera cryocrescens]